MIERPWVLVKDERVSPNVYNWSFSTKYYVVEASAKDLVLIGPQRWLTKQKSKWQLPVSYQKLLHLFLHVLLIHSPEDIQAAL